jgi:peptidoglycan/xylan/chitin deacetylase (PgdA/CDA1 family)/GT2 family glycosyltransferase
VIFSIIIPTFNRCHLLAECLTRVFDQDFSSTEYEVIVIVDGSTDGTLRLLSNLSPYCSLTVIEQCNKGPALARNAGVAAATGHFLLFLDDDILCKSHLLNEHLAGHSSTAPTVVHGPIYVAPDSPRTIVARSTKAWYESYYSQFSTRPLNVLHDGFLISNASMPRQTFLESGGFDPDLLLLEDFELGLRLQKLAVSFVYQPTALVHEKFSKSTFSFLTRDGFAYGRAEVIICDKHSEYRQHSALSTLGEGALWKRLMRQAAAGAMLPSQLLFPPLLWALERAHGFTWSLRLGGRLLALGHRLRVLQGARWQAGSFAELKRRFGVRLPVLLYHNICNVPSGVLSETSLSRRRFERQIGWLARRRYTAISPHDWFQWVTNGVRLPAKPILLTFDDGYADLVENAFPVLQHYGFRACVFLVTSQIGGSNTWDPPGELGPNALMTAVDIRTWATRNIDVGAHSRNHLDLTKISLGEATEEVLASARELHQLVGERVVSFAYPFGHFNPDIRKLVQETFEVGFSVEEGLNWLRTDLSALRRLFISSNTWFLDFVFRVQLGWSPIMSVRSRLRVRSRFNKLCRKIIWFLSV